MYATLEKGLFVSENGIIKPWDTEANAFIKKNTSLGGSIIKNKWYNLYNNELDILYEELENFNQKNLKNL